mmetsp:Transcript_11754/g.10388  ORF Transcript_11754/g.10388 Transcript_11754/m.10388 type:complete len:177 (+) Transcript_11754:449-979(+)
MGSKSGDLVQFEHLKEQFLKNKKRICTNSRTRERLLGFRRDFNSKKPSQELSKSLRARTRDNKLRIYKPLIRKKAKHAKNFNKKHSMRVDSLNYVPTETTLNEYRNRNQTRGIKIEKSSNISSGYGDITKIIKDNKKNRIQSAHPVAKQNKNCNLTTSYTLNNRPQSAKKNMKDYL